MLNNIFSIRNEDLHKVICLFGIKIKLKSKLNRLNKEINVLKKEINVLKKQTTFLSQIKRDHVLFTSIPDFKISRSQLSIVEHENNVENLMKNLGEQALSNLEAIIDKQNILYYSDSALITELYDRKELKMIQKCRELRGNVRPVENYFEYKNYKLPINLFEPSVFLYRHGINNLKTKNKISNKTIIDVGCHIADSVLVFREEFKNNKIISFEPSKDSYKQSQKTIELNHIENVVLENIGLGDRLATEELIFGGEGHATMLAHLVSSHKSSGVDSETVTIDTLDNYVKQNKIEVGLIKVDIEGFEPKFLKGAYNTIKEQKPILLLSIYHNYHDFYKLKPLIESWNLGYKFDFFSGPLENSAMLEILLLCEVR